jgi:hypothetical protein
MSYMILSLIRLFILEELHDSPLQRVFIIDYTNSRLFIF